MLKRIIKFYYSRYKNTKVGSWLISLRHRGGIFTAIWERLIIPFLTDSEQQYKKTGRTLQLFAMSCERSIKLKDALEADVYIAHTIQSIVFAKYIKKDSDSRLICDVVEHPRLDARLIKSPLASIDIDLLHDIFESNLRKCNHILTVSSSLSEHLKKYGVPVSVLENYRYKEQVPRSNYLRQKYNLSNDVSLVLCMSTITQGFEEVIRALNRLPTSVHLITLGKFVPKEYLAIVKKAAKDCGVSDRIHFLDPVPYNELTTVASSADIGIIVRDPKILNNYISLPNRVFDYICSGLPICSPYMPDIAKIINQYRLGTVLEGITEDDWVNGISNTLANKEEYSQNAKNAANELTWESKEPMLMDIIGDAKTVTIFALKDLAKNNRTKRIARTLSKNGISVKICGNNTECDDINDPNITFYQFPS